MDAVGTPLVVARHATVGHHGRQTVQLRPSKLQRGLPGQHAARKRFGKRRRPNVVAHHVARGVELGLCVPHLARLHHVHAARQRRTRKPGLPHEGSARTSVRGQQELPPRGGHVLHLGLGAVGSVRASVASLGKPGKFLQRQAQVRRRQRSPSVGVRRGKFLPSVPRRRHLVDPSLGRDGLRGRPLDKGLETRGMLARQADLEGSVVGRQIPLHREGRRFQGTCLAARQTPSWTKTRDALPPSNAQAPTPRGPHGQPCSATPRFLKCKSCPNT